MDLNKLPDNELKPLNIEATLTIQKRRYALFIAALMLVNIILFLILSNEERDITYNLSTALKTLVLGSIVLGFALGLLTALIPHKNLHYSEKYFHASLITILIIQITLIPVQIILSLLN